MSGLLAAAAVTAAMGTTFASLEGVRHHRLRREYRRSINPKTILTPTLGRSAENLMRARVVDAHRDLLPYRPVVLHLGVFPFVSDAVCICVVFNHGRAVQKKNKRNKNGENELQEKGWERKRAREGAGLRA